MNKKIIVASGGFDPIHSGHIEYLKSSKKLGNVLIVALNSDNWLIKKKGKFFMPFHERKAILESIKYVDEVVQFEDDSKGSAINALKYISKKYSDDRIIFCNGGDRTKSNIPEMSLKGIEFEFGVGGDKKLNSSSDIIKSNHYNKEERVWGVFFDLFHDKEIKVKELIIDPKKGMSFQRHFLRNEIWFVSRGSCEVRYSKNSSNKYDVIKLKRHEVFHVTKKMWHQIINLSNKPCHIIEIQYGQDTNENDIERLRFYEGNKIDD